MKKIVLLNLFLLSALALRAQKIRVGDSLEISFLKMDKVFLDSNNVYIKIAYHNIARRPILVYRRLAWGFERFSNMDVVVEKQMDGKYLQQSMPTYKIMPERLTADSLRHYDLPKKKIAPFQSDTLMFDLLRLMWHFDPGYYRIKTSLRIQTIQDTTEYHQDPTGATSPPEDKLKYITSDWIYFTVPKDLYTGRR